MCVAMSPCAACAYNMVVVNGLQVVLSSEAISHLHTSSPGMFVTFNFNGYETQVTSVKQGTRLA